MELNPSVSFAEFGWEPLLRLGSATLAGFALGLDRELRGYGAGLRTHALACFGTALMTISALAIYVQIGGSEPSIDPLRVIEGTASAVGLLAAALVFMTGERVHNLTTAVHLWVAGVIGIAFGAGQYPLAVIATAVSIFLLSAVKAVERRVLPDGDDDD